MRRIYFDSNVYRDLKKDPSLLERIKNKKDHLLFFFSHAHLLDLNEDESEKKFDDLNFMENLVDDNYLSLPYKEPNVNFQKASPRIAFDGIGTGYKIDPGMFDLNELLNLHEEDQTPEIKKAMDDFENLLGSTMKFNLKSNIEEHQKGQEEMWQKLIPDIKDEYTYKEWMEIVPQLLNNLQNSGLYKEIRKYSLENLQLSQKFNIDIEKFSFDEDLKDTPIQKSFMELVEQSLTYNDSKEQHEYLFFITAFNLLNILGIDKEKNKKAVFVNTINDAQHSYYASHCEFLVSKDEGFNLKSRVLYRLLGIETKVMDLNEFDKMLPAISGVNDTDLINYIKFLSHELQHSLIVSESYDFKEEKNVINHKLNNHHFDYFNYFNAIDFEEKGYRYLLYSFVDNYSTFTSYIEYEFVTNKVSKLFGVDDNGRLTFSDIDLEEIKINKWIGRQWKFDNVTYYLSNKSFNRGLTFLIHIYKN